MTKWMIDYHAKLPKLDKAVLIEGLPGIGNVGKVAVDFMIDELGAKKILDMFSYSFPHSVFINEDNLVDLPVIGIYHKRLKGGKDLLFLAGDIQPVEDVSCYEFCEEVISLAKKAGAKEVITLGGIGLGEIPKEPRVYVTGNSKKMVAKYTAGSAAVTDLYGVVGPIVGVSGVLVGLSKRYKVDSICLLAETYGHPMHLGMRGAREILKILVDKLALDIDMKSMNKDIMKIEADLSAGSGMVAETKVEQNNYIG